MVKTRTQKAALNTATATISEVVMLICGLILPRLILANFGSEYNGITSSAKQFLSAISILNVGVAGATRVALYKTLAANDIEASSAIVKATENYMRKVGLVLAAYIIILSIVYPVCINTGYEFFDVAILIIAAGIGTFGQYFFGTAYTAFLSADQCVYITNVFTIIATILNTVVSVFLIQIGCSIQVVKLGGAFVLFMKPLLQNIYVTRRYKINKKCKPDDNALVMRKDVMAHSIANIVHDNTDMIVLTIFCNVKIVSVYTVYNLVMGALKKTQQVFTTGTEAVFGSMWAKGEADKIRLNLGYYEWFVTFFVSVVFSTTLIMILPFISLYTKGVTDTEYILPSYAIVITLAQAWYCLRSPYLTLVQGAGQYKQTKTGAYFEAGINLTISIVLVQFVGIVGVALGTMAANIFRTIQYAIYIDDHIIKRGKTVFIKKIIWAMMNVIVIAACMFVILQKHTTKGWIDWILAAILCTLFSILFTFISSFVFYRKDMRGFTEIVKRLAYRRFNKTSN